MSIQERTLLAGFAEEAERAQEMRRRYATEPDRAAEIGQLRVD
jgi:hypothetical protein